MLAIAFYLAIVTFFIPKKYKQICGNISMGILGFVLIVRLLNFFFHFYNELLFNFIFLGNKWNPFVYLLKFIFSNFSFDSKLKLIISILYSTLIPLAIAYAATKVSIIKYKSDKEFEEGNYSETTSDIVSTAADGRLLRVVEVNAGLCTGTLRGAAIEAKINKMAAEGWKFEQFESIIGRCCLIFARYKAVICFSKEK